PTRARSSRTLPPVGAIRLLHLPRPEAAASASTRSVRRPTVRSRVRSSLRSQRRRSRPDGKGRSRPPSELPSQEGCQRGYRLAAVPPHVRAATNVLGAAPPYFLHARAHA